MRLLYKLIQVPLLEVILVFLREIEKALYYISTAFGLVLNELEFPEHVLLLFGINVLTVKLFVYQFRINQYPRQRVVDAESLPSEAILSTLISSFCASESSSDFF